MSGCALLKSVDGCELGAKRAFVARLYRFHCIGAGDAQFDLEGSWMPSRAAIRAHADRVALTLMIGGKHLDWTDWIVDVRDINGRRVLLRAFTEVVVRANSREVRTKTRRGREAGLHWEAAQDEVEAPVDVPTRPAPVRKRSV